MNYELCRHCRMKNEELAKLSKRQREILQDLSAGLSNKMIAATRGLSEYTVKDHRKAIYARLGIHNAAQATRLAVTGGK